MRPPARILAVDDNPAFADNLAEILRDQGYEVRLAATAREATEAAKDGFDVALVDLRLPDQAGTELSQRLRALAPDGQIVLLTGFATLETAIAAVRAGAFAYLVKPCATPELLLTVEQALRQVRLQAEKRELTRRAQVAEKLAAVGTMTAGLSHEIRNPLNAASLQLTVLERRVEKLPAAQQAGLREPLRLVRDEVRRLGHLVEDFLDFARPRELHPSPLDLREPLSSVLSLLEAEAGRRRIRLESELREALQVAGEPDRLRQVFMNLALNALEATPAGGTLRVVAARERDDAVISFDDSGPGVSEEARARIFEPFFTTKVSGSGLGLPIVHAIVTQHGGSVEAGSSALGGARFAVRLPLLRQA